MAAWVDHVREDHGRTTEHIVFQHDTRINGDVVLYLHAVADGDPGADHHILSEIAITSNARSAHDVAEMPYFCSIANLAVLIDDRTPVGEIRRCRLAYRNHSGMRM